jgi:magnesium-transporting ATPase (P-type)
MIGMSIVTTIINYYLLRNSLMKIKEIAERTHSVEVIRDGALEIVNSDTLVPGDILVPKQGPEGIPCDCVLVRG